MSYKDKCRPYCPEGYRQKHNSALAALQEQEEQEVTVAAENSATIPFGQIDWDAAIDGAAQSGDALDIVDAADWLAQPEPLPPAVLTGVVDKESKVAICGPSKARKSFFVLQMGVAIAAGLPARAAISSTTAM